MSEAPKKPIVVKEDGTLAGCILSGQPILPNQCATCPKHSDYTCQSSKTIKEPAKNAQSK
jgi:hypothetical protein